MAQYCSISVQEFEAFLYEYIGRAPALLLGYVERVYAWTVAPALYIHVYSSLAYGETRGVGEDAIRVVLMGQCGMGFKPLGKQRRVHRVLGWRKNLTQRLESWKDAVTPQCPLCNSYTVERTQKTTGKTFYGCLNFPQCRGTVNIK